VEGPEGIKKNEVKKKEDVIRVDTIKKRAFTTALNVYPIINAHL
jgi:hypothetical protein